MAQVLHSLATALKLARAGIPDYICFLISSEPAESLNKVHWQQKGGGVNNFVRPRMSRF